ncbi:MAG: M28 family peptidase, partial [Deltaproteobacteria bacterium]|nr:M28 family peptidase [Deltaproteobacteria bacterium]
MKRKSSEARFQRIFLLSIWLSVALALAISAAGLRKIPEAPIWKGAPTFKAANAFDWTRQLARGFPNRVPWRPERQAASNYLQGELRKLGYAVSTINFDETIGGRKVDGLEDIYATLPGLDIPDEYIVVLAHYDVTDTTVEGAADDASGIGTILELARIFKAGEPPRRNIVFLFTDSEEFGAFWGAHAFAAKFPKARQIVAGVSLDFVAPDQQQDIMVLTDGLKSGYTPLWLRELALASIRAVPYGADDTRHLVEFIQRAILIPPADHGAFLSAGIPSLNLFGRSTDFEHEMGAIHHTPEDNMAHLRVESFEPYGKATEILLHSIDQLPPLLQKPWIRNSNYWKLTDRFYLTGVASTGLQILLFVPFLIYILMLIKRLRGRRRYITQILLNELKLFSICFGSLVAGYALLRALPELNLITKYEMFPATQKSLVLYRPAYPALALVLTVVIALYLVLSRIFRSRTDRASTKSVERHIRHILMGIILTLVILLACAKNIYLASVLLIPPVYLWMFMKNNRHRKSRIVNAALFFGGFVSFIAICIAM